MKDIMGIIEMSFFVNYICLLPHTRKIDWVNMKFIFCISLNLIFTRNLERPSSKVTEIDHTLKRWVEMNLSSFLFINNTLVI